MRRGHSTVFRITASGKQGADLLSHFEAGRVRAGPDTAKSSTAISWFSRTTVVDNTASACCNPTAETSASHARCGVRFAAVNAFACPHVETRP